MKTKKDLLDEKNALVKSAQGIIAARTALNEGLSDDERDTLTKSNGRIGEINAELERIDADSNLFAAFQGAKGGETLRTENEGNQGGVQLKDAPRPKSLSDLVLTDDFVTRMKSGRSAGEFAVGTPELSLKAIAQQATSPFGAVGGAGVPYLTDYDWSIQQAKRDRVVVADLIGSGSISGTAISYLVESATVEGGYANVAEGTAKPQIQFGDPTPVVDAVKKIAGWTKFTDEFLEDLQFLKTEIDQRLMYLLKVHEEKQLLNGDGTGQNLLGIRKRSGVQTEASAGLEDNPDAIFRANTKIELATDYTADALVIHPLDYQTFRLNKDGNGQYLGGGYFQGQYGNGSIMENPPVWGLRTVVSTSIERGKVLVGNYAMGATLYRKGGVRIDVTNTNEDDFKNNLTMLRIEERIALAVRHPLAFVEVTLGTTPVTP